MKLKDIMRTNVGSERCQESLLGSLDMRVLCAHCDEFVTEAIYEVTDYLGNKIGEVSGERLAYLCQAYRSLNLDEIINSFSEGVVVIDAEGRICYENDAYSQIIGVPARKTLGKSMRAIEPDALLLQVLKLGVPMEREHHQIKSVGKYVAMKMSPIFCDGRVAGAFSIFRDVTQLDELDREVRRITGVAEEFSNQINVKNELERLQIVSRDPEYCNLISQAMTVSHTDATVLIRGENGVGKEVFTKLIHGNSLRRNKPLITVNCAAIPENLIESELFGYEEGTFTGAKKGGKIGKFQLAQGGTLFLDEIGDMPMTMQTKLLRVLQEGEIEKIGREVNIPVDVRVIAATNQPLEDMIREKKFRQDLYYRLNVIALSIPPLRERPCDIVLLTDHFLKRFNQKYGKSLTLSREVHDLLAHYSWPGNIRELQNCIESCVIMCSTGAITPAYLPAGLRKQPDTPALAAPPPNRTYASLHTEVARYEQQVIADVLAQCGGNRDEAARCLGVSRRTFYRKLSGKNGTECQI